MLESGIVTRHKLSIQLTTARNEITLNEIIHLGIPDQNM